METIEENKKQKIINQENVETKVDKKPKDAKNEIKPKDKAIVNGYSLRISLKSSCAVCKAIKNKNIDKALTFLENVISQKVAVKMPNREVPHQKGKGIAGARYPKMVAQEIYKLLKQLKANAVVNGIENAIITLAIANQASLPRRRWGRKAKRTHIYIEVQNKTKLMKNEK